MMERRSFIKQIAWLVLTMAGCRRPGAAQTGSVPAGPGAGGRQTSAGPPDMALSVSPTRDGSTPANRLRITCRTSCAPDEHSGHPLDGLILCAVEVGMQVPFCRCIGRSADLARILPQQHGAYRRYEFEVDAPTVLGLPLRPASYLVHAACRQHRSEVVVLDVAGSVTDP